MCWGRMASWSAADGTRLSAMRTMPSALLSTWLRTRPTGAATSIDGWVCRSSTAWKKSTPASKCCHGCARLMWSTRCDVVAAVARRRAELAHPRGLRISRSAEEDLRSVGRAHADERLVACALLAMDLRREELGRAPQRGIRVAHRESDAGHGRLRPVRLRTTEHDARGALRPEFDALRPVPAVRTEAELRQQHPHVVHRLGAQLHVVDVGGRLDGRQRRDRHRGRRDRPLTRPSQDAVSCSSHRSERRASTAVVAGPTGGRCR